MPGANVCLAYLFLYASYIIGRLTLVYKLQQSVCNRSKILTVIVLTILLTFFTMETVFITKLAPEPETWSMSAYILILVSIIFSIFIAKDFIHRSALREEKLNTQLNAIDKTHLIMVMDMNGNIISANRRLSSLLEFKISDLKKMNHKDITPEYVVKAKEYQKFWDTLRSGKSIFGEFEEVTKWGLSVWVQGNYTPLRDHEGNLNSILKIAVDRTADHRAQVEIIQKNSYLEYAAKILRHDMHSGINTYIPRGINSLKRRLTDRQIQDLNIEAPLKMIEGGLEHAQRVYNGVREFTNIVKSNSKMQKTEFNITDALNKYMHSTAYSKQVIIDTLPTIHANESLFCTAIDNLVRNGLKYNDSETKFVKIYMLDFTSLCVEDNGRGMTQSEFEYLSKPYTRKLNQQEQGSGLGLNICMAIFKEHGFTMTAEKLEQGTRLKINLKRSYL